MDCVGCIRILFNVFLYCPNLKRDSAVSLADEAAKLVYLQHDSLRRNQAYSPDIWHKKRCGDIVLEFAGKKNLKMSVVCSGRGLAPAASNSFKFFCLLRIKPQGMVHLGNGDSNQNI